MPYKKLEEYEPRQRGMVVTAKKQKGYRQLRDGDLSYEECPLCGYSLRVRKERQRSYYWCPCGYDEPAHAIENEVKK